MAESKELGHSWSSFLSGFKVSFNHRNIATKQKGKPSLQKQVDCYNKRRAHPTSTHFILLYQIGLQCSFLQPAAPRFGMAVDETWKSPDLNISEFSVHKSRRMPLVTDRSRRSSQCHKFESVAGVLYIAIFCT